MKIENITVEIPYKMFSDYRTRRFATKFLIFHGMNDKCSFNAP